jgi:transposase
LQFISRRTPQDRSRVVAHTLEGRSVTEIVELTGFPRHFVARWANRAHEDQPLEDRPRSGRSRTLSLPQQRTLTQMAAGRRGRSSRRVAQLVQQRQHMPPLSHVTVQRYWHRRRGLRPFHRRTETCCLGAIECSGVSLPPTTAGQTGRGASSQTKKSFAAMRN